MLRRYSVIAISICVLSLAAFCPTLSAYGQDPAIIEAVAKNKPSATPPGWRVFITFNKSFTDANEAEVMDTNRYSLFHAVSKTLIAIQGARIATTKSGKKIFSMVELRVAPLTDQEFYELYVTGLHFGTEAMTEPLVSRLEFTSIASTDEDPGKKLPLTAAEDREDSNIYLAGEVTRGSGTKFNGSADVKLSYSIPADFWSRSHFFEPLFDLKASSDPEADPDTMKMGFDWAFLLKKRGKSNKRFSPIWWKNSFLVEAERDFDNANFTWGTRFVAPSRVWRSKGNKVRFFVRPFVALEFGKNLKSPVQEAENKALARGLFGSSLNLSFPLKRKYLASVGLEASYVRRLLMLREIYFEKAEDDKLRAVFFARNPRDWIESKVTLNITDAFGFYVGYEYGQQPPSYKLVDHRMKAGLIYKVKFKKPDE